MFLQEHFFYEYIQTNLYLHKVSFIAAISYGGVNARLEGEFREVFHRVLFEEGARRNGSVPRGAPLRYPNLQNERQTAARNRGRAEPRGNFAATVEERALRPALGHPQKDRALAPEEPDQDV